MDSRRIGVSCGVLVCVEEAVLCRGQGPVLRQVNSRGQVLISEWKET